MYRHRAGAIAACLAMLLFAKGLPFADAAGFPRGDWRPEIHCVYP